MNLSEIRNNINPLTINNTPVKNEIKNKGVVFNIKNNNGVFKILKGNYDCDLKISVDGDEIVTKLQDLSVILGSVSTIDVKYYNSLRVEILSDLREPLTAYYNKNIITDLSDSQLSEILLEASEEVKQGFVEGVNRWIVESYTIKVAVNGDPILVDGDRVLDENGDPVFVDGPQEVDGQGNLVFKDGDPLRDENGDLVLENGEVVYEQIPVYEKIPVYEQVQAVDEDDNLLYEQLLEDQIKHRVVGFDTPSVIQNKDIFLSSNEKVQVNGNPVQGRETAYFGLVGDSFSAEADITDENGLLQTQIDQIALNYPPKLFLPVVKIINGDTSKPSDEVYMTASIVGGKLTATGKFPTAGNWVLLQERINKSLDEIGSDWHIEMPTLSFRIAEIIS